jgi:acetolactate synthase I/II/III large subunit
LTEAERLAIPVATTPLGKDVFDARHPLALGATRRNGTCMANAACRNADVIVALGTRFDDRSTSAWLPGFTYNIPPTKLIHVDIDPSEIGKNYPATVGILGDARTVLCQLLEAAPPPGRTSAERQGWLEKVGAWRRKWDAHVGGNRHSDAVPIHPQRVISELRSALPDNGILLSDVGVHHNWFISEFEPHGRRTFLQSFGFASMGFGVAGPLGAKLAAPDRPVVARRTACRVAWTAQPGLRDSPHNGWTQHQSARPTLYRRARGRLRRHGCLGTLYEPSGPCRNRTAADR